MTGLGQWLADVLNRHIERHNAVAEPERRHVVKTIDLGAVITQNGEVVLGPTMEISYDVVVNPRPCWACGDPRGFFAEHPPCSNVPSFKRDAETPQRTYGAGGLL